MSLGQAGRGETVILPPHPCHSTKIEGPKCQPQGGKPLKQETAREGRLKEAVCSYSQGSIGHPQVFCVFAAGGQSQGLHLA